MRKEVCVQSRQAIIVRAFWTSWKHGYSLSCRVAAQPQGGVPAACSGTPMSCMDWDFWDCVAEWKLEQETITGTAALRSCKFTHSALVILNLNLFHAAVKPGTWTTCLVLEIIGRKAERTLLPPQQSPQMHKSYKRKHILDVVPTIGPPQMWPICSAAHILATLPAPTMYIRFLSHKQSGCVIKVRGRGGVHAIDHSITILAGKWHLPKLAPILPLSRTKAALAWWFDAAKSDLGRRGVREDVFRGWPCRDRTWVQTQEMWYLRNPCMLSSQTKPEACRQSKII